MSVHRRKNYKGVKCVIINNQTSLYSPSHETFVIYIETRIRVSYSLLPLGGKRYFTRRDSRRWSHSSSRREMARWAMGRERECTAALHWPWWIPRGNAGKPSWDETNLHSVYSWCSLLVCSIIDCDTGWKSNFKRGLWNWKISTSNRCMVFVMIYSLMYSGFHSW